MAGKKDYFGIASRGFNHDARYGEKRESQGESLYDQLAKNGTPAEKAAIRKLRASKENKPAQSPNFKINPWS